MITENRTPSIEQVQLPPETPPAQPNCPTVQSLKLAALELYDVALRTRELVLLLRAVPDLDGALLLKVRILGLVAEQAITRAEGAL